MKHVIENKYWNIVEDYNLDKLLYLLIDRPDKILNDATFIWLNKGQYHRSYDLPAAEYSDGTKYWVLNGKRHREDGPAVEWSDGDKFWYLNGIQYSEKEYWEKV